MWRCAWVQSGTKSESIIADPQPPSMSKPVRAASARTRAIVATSIGNTLEWYDFAVYAQFASYIAANFFPGQDANARLVKAFLAFGVGFLIRPLGAVLIGSYGDRAGRKAALTLTLLLMAAGTAIIALSPTYGTIGIAAPILLLLGRLLQGFSAGGEVGGAAAFLFESADQRRRGLISSWLQASTGLSNILGALVAFTVTALLSANDVKAWGWRIPFVVGLLIVPAGLFLRRTLAETGAFQAEARRRGLRRTRGSAPWRELFQKHLRSLGVGFCVAALWAVPVYVLVIFLPTYVQRPDTYGFNASQAFGASLIGNIPLVIGCIGFGHLSDLWGRRTLLAISALLLFVCVLPLFMWLRAYPTTATLIVFQSAMRAGCEHRRRGSRRIGGDIPHWRALDGYGAGLQRGVHPARRIRSGDPHLVHLNVRRIPVRPGMVCDGDRDHRPAGDPV
jgi:MHS family proline/betaine transporter-like MFS transporter